MTRFIAAVISFLIAAGGHAAAESDRLAEAQRFFQHFVQLSHAFDVQVADLYADAATIRNKRHYPSGEVRELSLPAAQYKALIRNAMPVARARGDRSTYSDLKFALEGKGVRITGVRFSELKQYSSPVSLLVEPSASGSWLIVEELTESRP